MLVCSSKQWLGVECPGCGLQRSAIALYQGEFSESLALYPGLIPLILLGVISLLSIFRVIEIKPRYLLWMSVIVTIIIVGHYILKITGNAPWFYQAEQHFHL